MPLEIRSETHQDYSAIAEVNLLAFRTGGDSFVREVVMVDTLRHRPDYDPELGLVAELDGKVVGYALFSPCVLYFHGQPTDAVILAPLAVHPDYQKQGIGGKLLAEGHRQAAAKCYKLCILYGEKDYYPRFGYQPEMFSGRGLSINIDDIAETGLAVAERPLMPQDIPHLVSLWHRWHSEEPIAMFPGNSLVEWSSHYHNIRASAVMLGDQLIGYLRYLTDRPGAVLSFLANDAYSTGVMLGHLRRRLIGTGETTVRIPLNPNSQVVKELLACTYESEVRMSVYAMIKVLDENNGAVMNYCNYVSNSRANIGVLSLSAQFEWC